jgi:hypothetical protein
MGAPATAKQEPRRKENKSRQDRARIASPYGAASALASSPGVRKSAEQIPDIGDVKLLLLGEFHALSPVSSQFEN